MTTQPNDAARTTVRGRGTFARRTGQLSRELVGLLIVAIGLVLSTIAVLSGGSEGARGVCGLGGMVLPGLAVAWERLSIRCPQCRARVWWPYVSTPIFFRKNTLNPDRYGCSSCGYRPE